MPSRNSSSSTTTSSSTSISRSSLRGILKTSSNQDENSSSRSPLGSRRPSPLPSQGQRRRSSTGSSSVSSLDKDDASESVSSHDGSGNVCWGDVVIYEFPNILGDHPSVSDGGPPLTIGWKPSKRETMNVEYYEYLKERQQSADSKQRRSSSSSSFHVDGGTRGKLLLSMGYSLKELLAAIAEADAIKESRRSNMSKGSRLDSFKAVVQGKLAAVVANNKGERSKPRIFASKSA
ncbi:hypothetical protein ACA910_013855 [Epithemia clementina (nom. ined.)]